MHVSVHKFFSFNAIVCYVLQRKITHKTTPLRVVRMFFQIVAHISRRVLFRQCTARWPEAKVITKFLPIWQPLRCLPPWLWLIKNDFLFAGYGNIFPITVQGRLFCVLYALMGIPGTCLTRKSIRDKMTELFTKLITNFGKHVLKRSHLTQKVGLTVMLTTIVVTVVCLLSLMALLHGLRETQGMVIYQVFSIYFHEFEYSWFWWLLSQFKNSADYSLVLRAFAWAVRG